MVEFSLLCNGLTEKACASEIATEIRPIFIIVGVLLLLFVVIRNFWVGSKIVKKKVFYLGFVLGDFLMLLLLVGLYFMVPLFIRWFNIIKLG